MDFGSVPLGNNATHSGPRGRETARLCAPVIDKPSTCLYRRSSRLDRNTDEETGMAKPLDDSAPASRLTAEPSSSRGSGAAHDIPRCFVAYPSLPADRAESIETAIEAIHSNHTVDIVSWKSLAVSGRLMIGAICDEIRDRQVFIADVTGLNPNVLFELGYAIAHRKRVWLLLNPQIARARVEWDRFQLLTTIGYSPYSNSNDIVTQFYRDEPFRNIGQALYDELLGSAGSPSKKDALLYLQCDVNTDASLRIARRVSTAPIPSVIDDPARGPSTTLLVVCPAGGLSLRCRLPLLSTEYQHWQQNNAKHALIAGLAYGSAKPLLMLAHEPYSSPLDYRDLLRKHHTAAAAESIFADWLLPNLEQYEKREAQVREYKEKAKAQVGLRDITVGEPIAEFESNSIPEYYVSTAVYAETLRSRYSIVVGRKGSGKTAALYALTEELSADPRNHVCVIKPVGYELEGLISILRQELTRAEKGYLVESFWKFLLYTELTKSVYDQLLRKPEYYQRAPAESALCEFVEQYQSLISPEFSSRLESAVACLRELPGSPSSGGRQLKISELLHDEMLARLRVLLGEVLKNKAKVTVLVDNLDKAWTTGGDLALLSDLLFGLLSVSGRVADEFGRDASRLARVNLFFALFLRSDIRAAMLQFAKERDKLPVRLIIWEDSELLKRVIEQRFMKSASEIKFPDEVSATIFRGEYEWGSYVGLHLPLYTSETSRPHFPR